MDERLTSSFGSTIALSSRTSTSLNVSDMLRARVERGWIRKYDLWIILGIKPPVYTASEAGNPRVFIVLNRMNTLVENFHESVNNTHFCREDVVASDEQSK
jgi:hypothetical protein